MRGLWKRQAILSSEEKTFGANYPGLVATPANLGVLYTDQGRYAEAEPLLARSLNIGEMGLGLAQPETSHPLQGLAYLYLSQGRYTEAEPLYLRSLAIREKSLGQEHPQVADNLVNLGNLYLNERKYLKGEPYLRRAVPVLKKAFRTENPYVVDAMFVHADLLKGLNRKGEAQRLEAQAIKIQARLNKKKPKRQ